MNIRLQRKSSLCRPSDGHIVGHTLFRVVGARREDADDSWCPTGGRGLDSRHQPCCLSNALGGNKRSFRPTLCDRRKRHQLRYPFHGMSSRGICAPRTSLLGRAGGWVFASQSVTAGDRPWLRPGMVFNSPPDEHLRRSTSCGSPASVELECCLARLPRASIPPKFA